MLVWVPETLVDVASAGMRVSSTELFYWAVEASADAPFTATLRAGGLLTCWSLASPRRLCDQSRLSPDLPSISRMALSVSSQFQSGTYCSSMGVSVRSCCR